MRTNTLSQRQLVGHMALLKESLRFFDTQCYRNVAFLNEWSLYRHVRAFGIPQRSLRRAPSTLGNLLDILEPYIPFKLSEENFELFMDSVIEPELHQDPYFAHKAKLDFVLALRAIKEPAQWEEALSVCEAIRALKAALA